MVKHIMIIIGLMILIEAYVVGQSIITSIPIKNKCCQSDTIKLILAQYLIQHNQMEFEEKPLKDYVNNFKVSDVVNNETLGKQQMGIFNFYSYKEDYSIFIFIKDTASIRIYDMKRLDTCLSEAITFMENEKNYYSSKDIVKYIKAIINVYQQNENVNY